MRVALVATLLIALGVPASAQRAGLQTHQVGALTIALPAEFASIVPMDSVSDIGGGVQLRLGYFRDAASGREVTVAARTGLSWWQRFRFKHGYRSSGGTTYTYRRVRPRSLPLSDRFAEMVDSAFTVEVAFKGSAVEVRGCDGAVCYTVTAGGPAQQSGLQFAGLLSGVAL